MTRTYLKNPVLQNQIPQYQQHLQLLFLCLLFSSCLLLSGCYRNSVPEQSAKSGESAKSDFRSENLGFKKVNFKVSDDLNLMDLIEPAEKHFQFLSNRQKFSKSNITLKLLDQEIPLAEYLKTIEKFLEIIKSDLTSEEKAKLIQETFTFYEVNKTFFVSSYYEPIIRGSLKKTKKFNQALYRFPKDKIVGDKLLKVERKDVEKSIHQINFRNKKSSKQNNLIICYVDKVDAFLLQIQGSGIVQLEDSQQLVLNYAAKSIHPYVSIVKRIKEELPTFEVNGLNLENHLRSLSQAKLEKLLFTNPSYVYFRDEKLETKNEFASVSAQNKIKRAVTALGTEANEGRTIAIDDKLLSKGFIGILEFSKPQFSRTEFSRAEFSSQVSKEKHIWRRGEKQGKSRRNENAENSIQENLKGSGVSSQYQAPDGYQQVSRFVFGQDTGSAIKGRRIDLFWGSGDEAKRYANFVRSDGRLILFFIKPYFASQK